MTAIKTLQQVPQLFRYTDLQKFTNNANIFLTRALKNKLVTRAAKGVYINSFLKGFPGIEELACFLKTPSYISCEWALNHHGVIIQSPVVCTVLTLSTAVGASRNITYQGITIEFSHIASRLFSGFETKHGFNMALPEKALLDTIYLRKAIPFRDEIDLDMLDMKTFNAMAKIYPSTTQRLVATLLK